MRATSDAGRGVGGVPETPRFERVPPAQPDRLDGTIAEGEWGGVSVSAAGRNCAVRKGAA